jgi:hypothetical protein
MAQTVKYQPSHVVPTSQSCRRVRSRRAERRIEEIACALDRRSDALDSVCRLAQDGRVAGLSTRLIVP